MNAAEYWWVLSMSTGCLYALLASTEYQRSPLARIRIVKTWPLSLKQGVYCLYLPLLLALCALGLSDWLTEQSFTAWLLNLEEFGKLVGILLSLQAVYFLIHGRVFGTWVLLLISTLTLQLWLYYQALGIDFRSLGQVYAAALFVVLAAINCALLAIDEKIKLAFARPLAGLVPVIQWLFSTAAIPSNTVVGFDWVTLDTTLFPIGLMLLLVAAGYAGHPWFSRISPTTRI